MPCAAADRASKALKAKEAERQKSRESTQTPTAPALPIPSDLQLGGSQDTILESAVNMDLCLPSSLPASLRATPGLTSLVAKEARLRLPQCRVALATLRRRLRTCARLLIASASTLLEREQGRTRECRRC